MFIVKQGSKIVARCFDKETTLETLKALKSLKDCGRVTVEESE